MSMAKKRILNIGCGLDFTGTDRIDIMKTPATTRVYDLESGLPYENKTFNEIICYHVIGHIRNLKLFMDECYRVLKDGGIIILKTSNAGYLPYHLGPSEKHDHNAEIKNRREYIMQKIGKERKEDHHYYLFQPSHLYWLFERAGFKNIKTSYVQVQENKLKRFVLELLPKNMGRMVLEVRAFKKRKIK